MEDFLAKLQKVRKGFFKRMKLLLILDFVAFFSIFYSIFVIFNTEYFLSRSSLYIPIPIKIIPVVLAFIIAAACASMLHKKDRMINVSLLIEKHYPELKEKLRTAYDNREETNEIVDSLKSQVSEALNNVLPSQILAKGKMISRLVIAMIFITGVVTVSLNPDKYSIPVDTLTSISETITGKPQDSENLTIDMVGNPEDIEKAQASGGGNIFAKPKIASIEGRNIDLTIYGGEGPGFEVRDVSQTRDQFTKSAAFPVDVLGSNVSDGGFSDLMKKTETDKKLIQDYAVERSKI